MDHITQIENGLRLAIELKDQPVKRMNILDRMSHYHVPGVSIALIHGARLEWSKCYGVVQAGSDTPITTKTLFQAASVSKPVAALAALALVQAGLLDLDQDVNQVLKSWQVPENEFTKTEKVTLRRLLSHSAGLTVHGFPGYAAGKPIPDVVQVLKGEPPANTSPVEVDVTPGTIWRYSGGGTTVAQLLMMEGTGLPFAEVMKRYVLEPLGMHASTYEQPLPDGRRAEAALAHDDQGKPYEGAWHTYPEQAAAGLWTTPEELSRYVIALQNTYTGRSEPVITQQWAQEMMRVQMQDFGIGPHLGGQNENAWFAHGGSNAGFRCRFMGFLHKGQGIAVMTNADTGDMLVSEIVRATAAVYGWEELLPAVKEAISLDREDLQKLVGVYRIEEFQEVTIEVDVSAGQLVYQSAEFPLPWKELHAQSAGSFFDQESGWEIRFDLAGSTPSFTLENASMQLHAKRE
ncbi:MAG: serine hydrolase domain-containing protein [Anaerolineales bacterium]